MRDIKDAAEAIAAELEKRRQPGDMWLAAAARQVADALSLPKAPPKITVVLDGDSVEAAYSDTPVELLHVYGDKESLYRAIENGQPVMPSDRKSLNLAHKLGSAFAFNKVEVDHQPEAARFDHAYVNDPELVEEYTRSVEEELDHDA